MRYFKLREFDSPDAPESGKLMRDDFLAKLDKARGAADIPFKINSGYRTVQHNNTVGGSSGSSHMAGCAVDIHCTDSLSRLKIIRALLQVGFVRIGVGATFIHVDDDLVKDAAIWTYY